jgi:very-short-patch-repair endonuclease
MCEWLSSPEGKRYLEEEYVTKGRSTIELAEELHTYPNKVLRAMKAHRVPRRSPDEAQKAAIRRGRRSPPMDGRRHSPQSRQQIAQGVASYWQGLSDDERERRSEHGRRAWEAAPPSLHDERQSRAIEGFRRAAREGSRLEHFLLDGLRVAGHDVSFHHEFLVANEKMHIDLLLPARKVAIEIDGPTHYLPIFGPERLAEVIRADNEKDGLLTSAGYRVVRVRQTSKHLSRARMNCLLTRLLEVLQCLETNNEDGPVLRLEV